jgi:phospholipid/cholesterol/gamma-HCH transport system permease protein
MMSVVVRANREGDHACLVPAGPFDLAHATEVARAVEDAEPGLNGCQSVDIDLAHLDRIDGTGAFLLARLLDRLDSHGRQTRIIEEHNPEAARLVALYRGRAAHQPAPPPSMSLLEQIGASASRLPHKFTRACDFIGRSAAALPKAIAAPASVNWRSLPRLAEQIGADAVLVTSAANLLVGLIIGFLGISQLKRFGSIVLVPQLVVVAQFRELGPLVTAIIVAGRSGAGLAAELATMKVSEEIDALRSMGFDPIRWLVVPRCLALAVIVPLLTWIGDVFSLVGGFIATEAITDMPRREYIVETSRAITGSLLFGGLLKTPFLALAIGMIACGQGLSAHGGAAAVGASTTKAVVQAILGVIVIDAVFTLFYALMGI